MSFAFGQSDSRPRSLLIRSNSYWINIRMSCSMISFEMWWRMKSWWVSLEITLNSSSMGTSGLLVRNILNRMFGRSFASARSRRITRTSSLRSSRLHSSNASITRMIGGCDKVLSNFDNGRNTSFFHCSLKPCVPTRWSWTIASQIWRLRVGKAYNFASGTHFVVLSFLSTTELPWSSTPRLS